MKVSGKIENNTAPLLCVPPLHVFAPCLRVGISGVWPLKQTQCGRALHLSVAPNVESSQTRAQSQTLKRSECRLTHWIISPMVSHADIRAWHTQYDCAPRLERTRRGGLTAGEQETQGCSEERTHCTAASHTSLLPSRDQQHCNPENKPFVSFCILWRQTYLWKAAVTVSHLCCGWHHSVV